MRLARVVAGVMALLWIAGCALAHDPRADAIAAIKGEPAAGEGLYRKDCARCHGDTGAKLARGYYSDQEMADLFAYIGSFRK